MTNSLGRAALVTGKSIASGSILVCLAGIAMHFHITSYAYLASALAGSLAIYLWTRPGWGSIALTAALGASLAAAYAIVKGDPVLAALPAFCGLGSLGSLGLAALWRAPERRAANLDACTTAALFPMFLITSGVALGMTTALHPRTLDLFLYAFDARLGMQPSFAVGRFLGRFGALRQVCYFGYEALPLAMAIAFAMERSRPARRNASIMLAFMIAAVGGFVLYNAFPAAGPIHVFGKQFPYGSPAAGAAPYRLAAIGEAPRNAMPSVHIAMALLILWNSRLGPRIWRVLAGLLLGVTVLATLGFGEHYLVDLFVAVPFALGASALAASGVSWTTPVRAVSAALGFAMVAGWLMYLRLPSPPVDGAGPWIVLLICAAGSIVLESRLHRAVTPAVAAAASERSSQAAGREACPTPAS